MRVGFFTYGIDVARSTGIGQYTMELTRALGRVGGDVEVVLLNPQPESELPWYGEFESHPAPLLRRMPAACTLGNAVLHHLARKHRLDVLHDPCGIAPFIAPRGSYRRVTTVHDAVPYLFPDSQPLLTNLIFRTLVRAAARTSDAVITVSRQSADDLIEHARLPPEMVHPIPLASRFETDPDGTHVLGDPYGVLSRFGVTKPYFLFVGTLHPRKNLDRVARAFLEVRARVDGCMLVVVGPPYWGAAHELELVREHASRDIGVVFPGFVSDAELEAFYRHARALVFPSLYEGFGLPALEAMALGTPVIASNVGSLPEVVGDAGMLIDPLSTDSIAGAMRTLLEDEEAARRFRRLGKERAKMFTWRATAQRTLDVYRQIVATEPRRGNRPTGRGGA